jgi:hypothetical protein
MTGAVLVCDSDVCCLLRVAECADKGLCRGTHPAKRSAQSAS